MVGLGMELGLGRGIGVGIGRPERNAIPSVPRSDHSVCAGGDEGLRGGAVGD
jgi:hypothetical protein